MAKVPRRISCAAAAASLAKFGLPVFPVFGIKGGRCECGKSGCSNPGKHPHSRLVRHGFKDATTDPASIRRWWAKCPSANIGIATGEAAGTVVVDIDVQHDGDKTLKRLEAKKGKLPATVTAVTGGGGRHYYFRHPGKAIKSRANAVGRGIDIKADGGCITAPPSRHVSGKRYCWVRGRAPGETDLAELPAWLLKRLTSPTKKRRTQRTGVNALEEGQRNEGLLRVAGVLRRAGCESEAILAALLEHNKMKCRPTLSEHEVESIANSVMRYDSEPSVVRTDTDPHVLAMRLLATSYVHEGVRTLRFHAGTWYLWSDGRYRAVDRVELRARINGQLLQLLDSVANRRHVDGGLVSNVLGAMGSQCLVPSDVAMPAWLGSEVPDRPRELLAMSNGVLDLDAALRGDTDCMRTPTPEWFSVTAWPFPYRHSGRCKRWRAFLEEVLPGRAERALLQEYLGLCLTFDTSFHQFLVLVGEGANGKSVVTHVATHCLGPENVTHVGLERFGERFSLAPLVGRLANIVSELGRAREIAEDMLKAIVSGDRIQVERKYCPPQYVTLTTRLLFATNEIPRFADRSGGLWRRLMILPFNITVPEAKQDRSLARTICEEEAPGVFNWMLAGLRRLRERGGFRVPRASREALESHRTASNPALAFLVEHCRTDGEGRVECSRVYARYATWCEAQRLRPLTKQIFGQEVSRTFPDVVRRQLRKSGRRPYVYDGLSLVTHSRRSPK